MCLQEIFENCAHLVSGQNPNENRACPDKYVGKISGLQPGSFEYQEIPDSHQEKLVILVLESPHKKEFEGDLAPAKGQTGKNIRSHLQDTLSHHIDNPGDYDLILMNPVQYQLSLGNPPKTYRDKMFRCVWKNEIFREDFRNRLKEYIRLANDQLIIINACTKGDCRKCLVRLEISTVMNNMRKDKQIGYYELPHPSYGNFKNCRLKQIDRSILPNCAFVLRQVAPSASIWVSADLKAAPNPANNEAPIPIVMDSWAMFRNLVHSLSKAFLDGSALPPIGLISFIWILTLTDQPLTPGTLIGAGIVALLTMGLIGWLGRWLSCWMACWISLMMCVEIFAQRLIPLMRLLAVHCHDLSQRPAGVHGQAHDKPAAVGLGQDKKS